METIENEIIENLQSQIYYLKEKIYDLKDKINEIDKNHKEKMKSIQDFLRKDWGIVPLEDLKNNLKLLCD